jgi:hypothetical protein
MHKQTEKSNISRQPILWLVLTLLLLNLAILLPSGCVSARDSGATVTGRAMCSPATDSIAFMRVELQNKSNKKYQVTDSSGSFTMLHVPLGSYKFTWAIFGVSVYTQDLVVDQNEQTYLTNLPTMQSGPASLSGKITDDNGKLDHADIWLIYMGSGVAHTTSNNFGAYSFENVPDGLTTVVIRATGHKSQTFSDIRVGFEGVPVLDAKLLINPDVNTGRVKGTIKTVEGLVLNDAFIAAFPKNIDPTIYSESSAEALTTYQGYTLKLAPGEYRLVVSCSGFAPQTRLITVNADTQYSVNFVLTSEDDLWRDTNGQP